MFFTVVMAVVLIVSFALMFGLVEFSENVITVRRSVPIDDSSTVTPSDTEDMP